MKSSILLGHGRDNPRHIVLLLPVLRLGPFVRPVRKVLIVILALVVIGVEKVLQIIETYDIALLLR